ncbi:MAG: hypothetical protein BRC58_11450 [Cyanobacteria bacterium QS_8_64_29]|nr:MAG: hypothetical protein BRC58_11450 [Cyanobacteria bacterium QS_8_64_29]
MSELLLEAVGRNALAAGLLASVACGIVGAYVVINRIVFVSAGIAHAAYGGIGLGAWLQFDPVLGGVGFGILAALAMGTVQRQTAQPPDALISAMWAVGMALGLVFLELSGSEPVALQVYLFGDIASIEAADLGWLLGLDVALLGLAIPLYPAIVAISFDPAFATVRNVPVGAIYLGTLGAVAATTMALVKLVGLILAIALLTLPAAIAGQWARDLKAMMALATAISALACSAGLGVAHALNFSSGATIVLAAGLAYAASLGLRAQRD